MNRPSDQQYIYDGHGPFHGTYFVNEWNKWALGNKNKKENVTEQGLKYTKKLYQTNICNQVGIYSFHNQKYVPFYIKINKTKTINLNFIFL